MARLSRFNEALFVPGEMGKTSRHHSDKMPKSIPPTKRAVCRMFRAQRKEVTLASVGPAMISQKCPNENPMGQAVRLTQPKRNLQGKGAAMSRGQKKREKEAVYHERPTERLIQSQQGPANPHPGKESLNHHQEPGKDCLNQHQEALSPHLELNLMVLLSRLPGGMQQGHEEHRRRIVAQTSSPRPLQHQM